MGGGSGFRGLDVCLLCQGEGEFGRVRVLLKDEEFGVWGLSRFPGFGGPIGAYFLLRFLPAYLRVVDKGGFRRESTGFYTGRYMWGLPGSSLDLAQA